MRLTTRATRGRPIRYLVIACASCLLALGGAPAAELPHATTWLGNSFPGSTTGQWVQDSIVDACVLPDGSVITTSEWDEWRLEVGVYQDGQQRGGFQDMHGMHGSAIAANGTSVYLACNKGGGYGVQRYDLKSRAAVSSVIVFNPSTPVSGLAVGNGEVYASDPGDNRIQVLDAVSMRQVRSFPCNAPGRLAVDRAGTLWVVEKTTNRILHRSPTGSALGGDIADAGVPTALAIDTQGRLMVGDSGARQQILFYDVASAPRLVATFGDAGGIYSGVRGEVRDTKLISPNGVGMDSAGSIYVTSGLGRSTIRKFSSSGQLQWFLKGLEFVDCAVPDPATDGVDVYSKQEHFVMDYTKSNGQEWTWKGLTLDPIRYPNDPRLSVGQLTMKVVTVQGRKYMVTTTDQSTFLIIYRFDGEIAVPSVIIAPLSKFGAWMSGVIPPGQSFMWRDGNGDGTVQAEEIYAQGGEEFIWGWDMDEQGNIWQAQEGPNADIRKLSLQGIDAFGNPIYDLAHRTRFPKPPLFTSLERIVYQAASDTMYLSGYTTDNPKTGSEWGSVGREIVRYDGWSTGNRTPRCRIVLPYPDPNNLGFIKCFSIAGQRVFASILKSTGRGTTNNPNAVNTYVYDSATGAVVGEMLPGPEVGSEMGWIDASYGGSAFQRSNGEYLYFQEEDAWAKTLLYRLGGTSAPSGRRPFRGIRHAIPGTIEAEDFDDGGEGVAYHDVDAANQGGAYRPTAVDLFADPGASNATAVGWAYAGEWSDYSVTVQAAGSYAATLRVATAGAGGSLHLECDRVDVSGAVRVPDTGGWNAWATVTTTVALPAGEHVVRLVLDANGGTGWVGNIDSLGFAPLGDTTPPICRIVGPSADATVSGTVRIRASASDDRAVASVQFRLDGSDLAPSVAAAPYELDWNTTASADGVHRLSAIARDAAGNASAPSTIAITISNHVARPFSGVPLPIPGVIQAEDFDTGGEGIAYHDTDAGNNGGGYRPGAVDIRACLDTGGGWQVGWFFAGEWLEYSTTVAIAGTYDLAVRVATGSGGGSVHVSIDGIDATGALVFGNTGGYDTWQALTKKGIAIASGAHLVRLTCDTGNLDCNWLSFTAGGGTRLVSGQWYKLVAKHSGKCLDVTNAGSAEGVNVQQWSDNGSPAQQWRIDALGDGSYTLTAACSGKCLDVANAGVGDGENVHQWTPVGGANQHWRIEDTGGGWYRLTAVHSGKVLDVSGISAADGANVQQWSDWGGDNQRWAVVPIAPMGISRSERRAAGLDGDPDGAVAAADQPSPREDARHAPTADRL